MDIQTRKIEFVQAFLKLQSEELISRLESLLKSNETNEDEHRPMSVDEFNERINQSMSDSRNERLTISTELINEIDKWE